MDEYTFHVFQQDYDVEIILNAFNDNGFHAYCHKDFSNLIICKPKGPYPLSPKIDTEEIIVDKRASEMIYQGADVFRPCLKSWRSLRENDFVNVVSPKAILVAIGKITMDSKKISSSCEGIVAENIQSPFIVPNLNKLGINPNTGYFQSFPAYLTSLNLNPLPGERILDACAAPGNKTLHLSELSQGKAKILAIDKSKNRLEKLKEKIALYKLNNIETMVGDISKMNSIRIGKFDKILLDPPCTALGLRPRLHFEFDNSIISSTYRYQKALLYSCVNLLKSNGVLVYSTCTITKEENEDVIKYAIENLNLEPIEQEFYYAKDKPLLDTNDYKMQNFLPGIDKTVGFFITKMVKKDSS